MALSNLRALLTVLTLSAASAVAPLWPSMAADDAEPPAKQGADSEAEEAPASEAGESVDGEASDRLSAHEFFTLAPFVVPVIDKGEHRKQFVLVVAIGLEDEDDRDELRRLSPKMRNEIYQLLFKMISFRTIEPRIPRTEILESRLTKIARRIAGDEMIKSIVVQAADVTDVR